jgi:hypothetical protein
MGPSVTKFTNPTCERKYALSKIAINKKTMSIFLRLEAIGRFRDRLIFLHAFPIVTISAWPPKIKQGDKNNRVMP